MRRQRIGGRRRGDEEGVCGAIRCGGREEVEKRQRRGRVIGTKQCSRREKKREKKRKQSNLQIVRRKSRHVLHQNEKHA